jgi:hypothetical protein
VSYKDVTVGNLVYGGVTALTPTLLTTVQSVDPMYCYVDVDENSVLKYQKLAMQRKTFSPIDGRIPCFLQLGNEANFPHEGFVDFVDNHVDTSTGTLKARGVFPNPKGDLTPGFFASMRVPGSGKYKALLIPDSAVLTDQDRRNVLLVGDGNLVKLQQVELGALFGGLRAITKGLGPDDKVIINGQMHARPGAPVAPVQGSITANPTDFADMGSTTPPGRPSTDQAATTEQASSAAEELQKMEATGAATEPASQPGQPIMQYAKPSPNDVTDVSGTSFSAPASAPSSAPATQAAPAASAPATSGVGAGQ